MQSVVVSVAGVIKQKGRVSILLLEFTNQRLNAYESLSDFSRWTSLQKNNVFALVSTQIDESLTHFSSIVFGISERTIPFVATIVGDEERKAVWFELGGFYTSGDSKATEQKQAQK
jgi:predicted phosphoadenosine phosphosulfate sulfurtransferase